MDFKQKLNQSLFTVVAISIATPASAWRVREVHHVYTPAPVYVPVSTVTYVEPEPDFGAVGCVLGAAAVGTVLGLGIGSAIESRERKKEQRRQEEEDRARARRAEQRRYEEERALQRQLEDDYLIQRRHEEAQARQKQEAALQRELQEQAHQQKMEEMQLQAELDQKAEATQNKGGILSRFFSWIGSWFSWLW
jgi:hypothetical protein